jgi:hypothetical protein
MPPCSNPVLVLVLVLVGAGRSMGGHIVATSQARQTQ